jgi:hypothetical protein
MDDDKEGGIAGGDQLLIRPAPSLPSTPSTTYCSYMHLTRNPRRRAMLLITSLTSTSAPRSTRRTILPYLPSRPTDTTSDDAEHIDCSSDWSSQFFNVARRDTDKGKRKRKGGREVDRFR